MPRTLSAQGSSTAPPQESTTTVLGFAAATASMSRSWPSGRDMSTRSKPSDSHWGGSPAKTTAVPARRAAATASSMSVPGALPSPRQPCTQRTSGQAPAALVSFRAFMWLLPEP